MESTASAETAKKPKLLILWLLLSGILLTVLAFRPLNDVDLFFSIRAGESFLPFLKSSPVSTISPFITEPISNQLATLFCILAAFLNYCGGLPFLKLVLLLAYSSGFFLASVSSATKQNGAKIFAVCFAVAASLPSVDIRPEAFSVLGLGTLLYFLESKKTTLLTILALFGLGVLWQNIHPSLIMGVGWCIIFSLTRIIRPPLHQQRIDISFFAVVILGCCLFLSPVGINIIAISKTNLAISRDLLQISEWQPPWHASVRDAMLGFWVLAPITLVSGLLRRSEVPLRYWLLFLVLTALTLSSSRFVLPWSLVIVVIWSRILDQFTLPKIHQMTLLVPALIFLTGTTLTVLKGNELNPEIPSHEVKILASIVNEGTIYNYREWAGPLAFLGSRGWNFRIDGRLYLYNQVEWELYYDEARGKVPLATIVDRYHPVAFFLRPSFNTGLISQLNASSQWTKVLESATVVIFVPIQLNENTHG